jgi:hypothetical protein
LTASRHLLPIALLLALTAASGGDSPPAPERQRGVSWVGGREPVTAAHLQPLVDRHVNWIVQTPFGWQRRIDEAEVHLATGGRVWWGESDEGLETTARLARERHIRTLLKPHIWLAARDGTWRGEIAMADEAAWTRWFESYRAFLLHYARLAEHTGMEALCIGTELHGTLGREADWRRLIREVRKVYRGRLTYAANWNREFAEVPFWDALDFIGIQGYFPLADGEHPSVEALKRGWTPWVAAIEAVQRRIGKPVVFTEIGYRSTADAAVRPWEWPHERMSGRVDTAAQANAYQAFFEVFWDRDWVAGAYFWKWYPALPGTAVGRPYDFTPQGKPAEEILARWYRGGGAAPRPTGE